jgi:hypothetical protein
MGRTLLFLKYSLTKNFMHAVVTIAQFIEFGSRCGKFRALCFDDILRSFIDEAFITQLLVQCVDVSLLVGDLLLKTLEFRF